MGRLRPQTPPQSLEQTMRLICSEPTHGLTPPVGVGLEAGLACLERVVVTLGIGRVFEFGAGPSTRLFLGAGCRVTAVDDNPLWLEECVRQSGSAERKGFRPLCRPLRTVYLHGAPYRGWALDEELRLGLAEAELVWINAPRYPPFREHALVTSLKLVHSGLIVVADAGHPIVHGFCLRLAMANQWPHFYAAVNHGLFFYLPPKPAGSMDTRRDTLETLRAWSRFFTGRRGWERARPG